MLRDKISIPPTAKCPGCGAVHARAALEANLYICPGCNHYLSMPSRARGELGGPSMDNQKYPNRKLSGSAVGNVSDMHNASVDEDAARQGGCAQVHLPTGRMCMLRHGHNRSCDFRPAGEADAVLARHKAADHW